MRFFSTFAKLKARGNRQCSLFLMIEVMDESKIKKVFEQKVAEDDYNDCYLVEITYSQSQNHLTLYIGSDSGMTLSKCQAFSRHMEAYLDESLLLGEKYELDVSSPGVGKPLRLKRQYHNNIGRYLKIVTEDGSRVKGELKRVTEDGVIILQKKGKNKSGDEVQIPFDQITTALVQIKF